MPKIGWAPALLGRALPSKKSWIRHCSVSFLLVAPLFLPNFIAACQRSCGKVMFSQASVSSQGSPCSHCPWCLESHCTGPAAGHQVWDPQTLDLGHPLLLTSGDQYWRPVPTCLLEDTSQSNIWWWPLKHVQFISGWYASYWNVFLFFCKFNFSSAIKWSVS